jgi:tRNA (guanine6-N2)-methyltransferase
MAEDISREQKHLDQTRQFMATVVPGLESMLIDELCSSFPSVIITDKQRGKIFFEYRSAYRDLLALRMAENLYLFSGSFHIGPHKADLLLLSPEIKNLDIMAHVQSFMPATARNGKVIVSGSRSGKQTYSRFEAAEAVTEALLNNYPFSRGSIDDHQIAFRFDIMDEQAYFYCQLTTATLRYRAMAKEYASGAIRPTIARAMVKLSEPDAADVFLDPFCGSGTIVYERMDYSASKIMACDLSAECIEIARANLATIDAPARMELYVCDARYTGLPDRSVTKIVSNPPWGMQIKVEDIVSLYTRFLAEARRILKKDGLIVLLTTRESELISATGQNGLTIRKLYTISQHGQHPSIFILRK